ncbi:hypothetical protein CEXT_164201 [Caerostris extrusa]|uniref:Uncharacterized protein n=1 Tax=Caerostris extrusa TaxID=172846 RepID=A0AAV4MHL0_CAEEX|nr:hypothetical protein CEXT_164201 [Caerostris extrusa]
MIDRLYPRSSVEIFSKDGKQNGSAAPTANGTPEKPVTPWWKWKRRSLALKIVKAKVLDSPKQKPKRR